MGGITKSLFGGSSQQSSNQSGNNNQQLVTNALTPALGSVGQSSGQLAALLGLNGTDAGAQAAAQAGFANTPGYQFARQQGLDALTQNGFARGLGNSGATLKGLDKFSTGLADQTYQNYMSNLMGYGQQGLGAAQTVGGVGQYSRGTSSGDSSSGGLGRAIGFGLAFSDRRLKKDISKVGEHLGIPVYDFRYNWEDADTPLHVGVMADELAKVLPSALGSSLFGYARVHYDRIPGWEV